MPDRHAVIWTRTPEPVKMGALVVTQTQCRFAYDPAYLRAPSNEPGLSLLSRPRIYGRHPVVFEARPGLRLHPRLLAMIPTEGRGNLQRRLYTRILADGEAPPPAPGFETDWALLLLAGRNGIGHLDVFPDDRSAERWYADPPARTPSAASRSALWRALREDIAENTARMDARAIAELLGPTPSAGGMIPKLLVAIPDAPRWNGRFASPGVRQVGGEPYVDVLLKVEPLEYQGIAALEAACLALHQAAGFETPRWWRATLDDVDLLAVERFDRTPEGLPVPLESFFATFAEGDRRFTNHRDIHLAEVARRLARLGEVVNLDVRKTQQEVFRRQLFALCTGNGDLHLENLSLIGGPEKTRLSPVYDPAPMRAWPRHDLRLAIPLDLDLDDSRPLAESLLEAGLAFGLGPRATRRMARQVLSQTEGYRERLETLPVPGVRIERLQAIATRERRELEDALVRPPGP